MKVFAIFAMSQGIIVSGSEMSPPSDVAANHVLLALLCVLFSKSLCVWIGYSFAESELLQDFFQRYSLFSTSSDW